MSEKPDSVHFLLYKKLHGTLTTEEKTLVEEALSADPEVAKAWHDIQTTFNDPEIKRHFDQIDPEQSYQYFRDQIPKPIFKRLLIAASVLLLAGALVTFRLFKKPAGKQSTNDSTVTLELPTGRIVTLQQQATIKSGSAVIHSEKDSAVFSAGNAETGMNTLRIPKKITYKTRLSDGTTIAINCESVLKFPFTFSGPYREIYLEGEAYLTVASDPDHPFVIHTNKADIKVMGTSFGIRTYDGAFKTMVSSGKVEVSTSKQTLIILPGKSAEMDLETDSLKEKPFDQETELSWLTGTVVMSHTSLLQVGKTLERMYDIPVIFERPEIGKREVTVMIKKADLIENTVFNINFMGKGLYSCEITPDRQILFK